MGATINNKSTGVYSDISITSFYGSNVISCAGNGGMFLTNDKNCYERAKVLRSWGRMSTLINDSENINKRLNIKLMGYEYDRKFVFSEKGYNFEEVDIEENNISREEMASMSKGHTVPQILINDLPIGGFEDLVKLFSTEAFK